MSTGITLVTGATGHLGANLVRRLLAEGERVRVMRHSGYDNGALAGLDVERVFADLRNSEAVSAAVKGCARVYHCAALVSTIEGNAAHKRANYSIPTSEAQCISSRRASSTASARWWCRDR